MSISGLREQFTAYYAITILPNINTKLSKLGQIMVIGGVKTHSYDCPTHTEYVNHLLCMEWIWYKYEVGEVPIIT